MPDNRTFQAEYLGRRTANADPVIRLMQALAGNQALPSDIGADITAVDWIVTSGLAPLFWDRIREASHGLAAESVQRLKTADLTARLLSAATFEVLETILSAAAERGCPITLLKGVSIAQQCYPQPHWRPMRDIDLLVDENDQGELESLLRGLGFRQEGTLPPSFFAEHHHSMPFHHPEWHCWVEVHSALFRADSPQGRIRAFQPQALRAQRISIARGPTPLWRLSDELQLVYTAVHWGAKLTVVGGMIPIVDTLLLLKSSEGDLDWDRVLSMCADATAARYLALMLAYLQRHDLYTVPEFVWRGLASGRRSLGTSGLNMLLAIIDDYLAGGRPFGGFTSEAVINTRWHTLLGEEPARNKLPLLLWRTLFPPAESGRYHPMRQLRRVRSLLRSLRRQPQESR